MNFKNSCVVLIVKLEKLKMTEMVQENMKNFMKVRQWCIHGVANQWMISMHAKE